MVSKCFASLSKIYLVEFVKFTKIRDLYVFDNLCIIKSINVYLQILIIILHWPNSRTVGKLVLLHPLIQ